MAYEIDYEKVVQEFTVNIKQNIKRIDSALNSGNKDWDYYMLQKMTLESVISGLEELKQRHTKKLTTVDIGKTFNSIEKLPQKKDAVGIEEMYS